MSQPRYIHASNSPKTLSVTARPALRAMASRSAAFLDGSDAVVVAAGCAVLEWVAVAVVDGWTPLAAVEDEDAQYGYSHLYAANADEISSTKSVGTLALQGSETTSAPGVSTGITVKH